MKTFKQLSISLFVFATLTILQILNVMGHDEGKFCYTDQVNQEMADKSPEFAASREAEEQMAAKMERLYDNQDSQDYKKFHGSSRRRLIDLSIPVVKVPIVFHILYDNDEENLSMAQLNSAVNALNEDFRATRSEVVNNEFDDIWATRLADTRIEFYIAHVERKDVSTARATQGFTCSDNAKLAAYGGSPGWDQSIYANVYVCNLYSDTFGTIGYAYFPCLLDTVYKVYDGIVMDSGAIGSVQDDDGTFFFRFTDELDRGRVLTHEFGHYFNLYHIWGIYFTCDEDIKGDYVSDTPYQLGATGFYCPTFDKDTCDTIDPETGVDLRDMFENPMDYSLDECKLVFTERQALRMRATLGEHGCRSEMYENGRYYDCSEELGQCASSPCDASEAGACINYQSGQGCAQCGSGYWKKDNNHACISCDIFGDGCMFCQDGNGCGQCSNGYSRTYLHDCDVYVCEEDGVGAVFSCDIDTAQWHVAEDGRTIMPCNDDGVTPCDCGEVCHCTNCHSGQGCAQCENGYFKKSNAYPCILCEEYYGDTCLFCQENQGCGQCRDGCNRYYNSNTGLWDCDCPNDYCPDGYFCCVGGCEIWDFEVNDNSCDCPLCDDEENYSCTSCRPWANEVACDAYFECASIFTCSF